MVKTMLLCLILVTSIGATQRDEARDKQRYDASHRIQFEVKVYPVELKPTWSNYYRDPPLVFAYTFATAGEAFNFARIVTHRGLEVDYCPPGNGIRVIFPTIAKTEISRRTCRPRLCDTDVACIPQ